MSDKNLDQYLTKLSFRDFEVLDQLGRGSYSEVLLVKHKISREEYAMKILNKKKII